MFNLLVMANGWSGRRDDMPLGRIYIDPDQQTALKPAGLIDWVKLQSLPALFVEETSAFSPGQVARVGTILQTRVAGQNVHLEYLYDPDIPPIPQAELIRLAPALHIPTPRKGFGPLEHTHWSVQGGDLFRVLLTELRPRTRHPTVFPLPPQIQIDLNQVSAMMPFAGFDRVYGAITRAVESLGMRCNRADDIWENPSIIQDIVNLIDRSAIVICDCSRRNPNVFYEIGLAHAWGKEVILITQNGDDIPFDLTHLRHIRYLPNDQGLAELEQDLVSKIRSLRAGE